MENRHGDHDGSDIFWPGYVDATTNLILNLLFLLTILIVAVFMFALELGRSSRVTSGEPAENAVTQERPAPAVSLPELLAELGDSSELRLAEQPVLTADELATAAENEALKREIERLTALLAEQTAKAAPRGAVAQTKAPDQNGAAEHAARTEQEDANPLRAAEQDGGGVTETVDASIGVPAPQTGLDKALASDAEVLVRFKEEAIAFTSTERERLVDSLQPIVTTGQASLYVEVPAGFSEAKRLGYYRAMAVRTLLIEMGLPSETIDVAIIAEKNNADATQVSVRSQR